MKKVLFILLFCILFCFIGCQSNKIITPSPTTSNNQNTTQSPLTSVSPLAFNAPQPKQLEAIESDSEDIMDDIDNKDWAKAQAKVNKMKTNINELKPLLQMASVPSSLIDGVQTSLTELEKQVSDQKVYESKVQANAITKYIPDIADSFQVILPTDLGRLDYIGREIILNIENKNWSTATSNLNNGKEIWARLRSTFDTTNKDDAAKYDQSIKNLGDYISQKDAVAAVKEANTLLDLTDVLETDYSNQKK